MAQFVKISQAYINLDLVRHVEPDVNGEGSVVRAVVIYSNGDQGVLIDEAARALLAVIDPPQSPNRGFTTGPTRRPRP